MGWWLFADSRGHRPYDNSLYCLNYSVAPKVRGIVLFSNPSRKVLHLSTAVGANKALLFRTGDATCCTTTIALAVVILCFLLTMLTLHKSSFRFVLIKLIWRNVLSEYRWLLPSCCRMPPSSRRTALHRQGIVMSND